MMDEDHYRHDVDFLTAAAAMLIMAAIVQLPEPVRLDSDRACYAFTDLAFMAFGPDWPDRVRYM